MHLKLAFRRLLKTPLVSSVAVLSLALGIGANAAIFSLFDQVLLRAAAGTEPARAGQPVGARPQAWLELLRPGRRLRLGLQLPDVPRPGAAADGVHRHRGARGVRRQPGPRGPDDQRRRHAGVRVVLPGARRAAGARTAAGPERRPNARRPLRRRAEPRLLDDPARRRPQRPQPGAHRERPANDHRRRGAARVHQHDARRRAGGVRAADDARD